MSELRLRGDLRTALTHMTMLGLAAILEEAGVEDVRVGWTDELDARPVVWTAGVDFEDAAEIVRQHAVRRASERSWLAAVLDLRGREAGLMSPRITAPRDRAEWERLADARAGQIDAPLPVPISISGSWGRSAHRRTGTSRRAPAIRAPTRAPPGGR